MPVMTQTEKNFIDWFTKGTRSVRVIREDFTSGGADTTGAASIPTGVCFGTHGWRCSLTGAGAATTLVTTSQDSTHFGVVQIETGTTTTGQAAFALFAPGPITPVTLGSGQTYTFEAVVKIPTLSTGTERFVFRIGLTDAANATLGNGICFEYSDNLSSGAWRGIAAASSVSTVASGGSTVTVTAGQWYRLTATWDGTTATFYVDGVSIGSTTTGLPSASIGESAHIIKLSLGTTTRTALVDICDSTCVWSTPRAA